MTPLYHYQRADGSTFERFERMTSEPLTKCPHTGQKCERVIQPVRANVKGGTPTFHSRVPRSYYSSPNAKGEK